MDARDLSHEYRPDRPSRPGLEVRAPQRPTILCIVGSSKFKTAIMGLQQRETLKGKIVLQDGFFHHVDLVPITEQQQRMLELQMLAKIELADEILIVNVNGYIGQGARAAIAHARHLGKKLSYYEPVDGS